MILSFVGPTYEIVVQLKKVNGFVQYVTFLCNSMSHEHLKFSLEDFKFADIGDPIGMFKKLQFLFYFAYK